MNRYHLVGCLRLGKYDGYIPTWRAHIWAARNLNLWPSNVNTMHKAAQRVVERDISLDELCSRLEPLRKSLNM